MTYRELLKKLEDFDMDKDVIIETENGFHPAKLSFVTLVNLKSKEE